MKSRKLRDPRETSAAYNSRTTLKPRVSEGRS